MNNRTPQPLTAEERAEAGALCEAATPGPLGVGILDPELDPVEMHRECLAGRDGYVWLTHAPEGIVCVTGNGPKSQANAAFISAAWTLLPRALATIDALESERDEALEAHEALMRMHQIGSARLHQGQTVTIIGINNGTGLPDTEVLTLNGLALQVGAKTWTKI